MGAPADWQTKSLKEIGDIVTGNTPSTKDPFNYGSDIPFVKPPELKSNLVANAPEMLSEKGAKSARVLPPNSVMVSCIGNLGKVAINKVPVATNQQINSVVPSKDVDSKFLFYLVQSQSFRNQLSALSSATTVSIVNKGNFSKVEIPVPTLQTQHRIVEKIEELFSELDNGVANLKKAQQQLKTYRQAVLKDAFEGKLTKGWREQQTDLPSPDELLQQIEAERQAHRDRELAEWEKEVEQWEKDGKGGRKPAKPRKAKVPDPFIESEIIEFSDLPNEWMHVRPENISSPENYSIGIGPFGSNLKVADYRDSGVPLIFVRNITNENFGLNQKFIDEEKYEELKAHSVKPLDILVTKMGDPPGDCTIYPEGLPNAIITADCLKFRVAGNYIDRKFYRYCIESFLVKRQLGVMTKGVAQKKISAGRFKTLILPLPSLEEQNQIVQEIESRLSIVDQLEKTIEENLLKSEALRQSILKKAFNGELVEE